jgi:PAS domain S-box-containing protein
MALLLNENLGKNLQLRTIADYITQLLWITDTNGKLIYCNKRWSEYTGLNFDTTVNGGWVEIVHPDDVQASLNAWNSALISKSGYEIETRFKRCFDSHYRWHLIRESPIKNDQDEVLHWVGTGTDIDDVKKVEEALREEHQRYNALVQSLHSVYWTTDAMGAIVEPQPSWESFSGQSFATSEGFGWVNAIHPDDRESTLTKWNEALKNPQIYENILRIWTVPANEYVYCIARANPMFDDHGKVIKWIGSCLNIDLQKQTEKKLQEVTDHLTLALEAANAGAWRFDVNENKVALSENMYKLFGIAQDSVNEFADFTQLVNSDDTPAIKKEMNDVLENGKPNLKCEYRVTRPDGVTRSFSSRGKLCIKDNKKILIGASFDVTERVQLEQIVRQNQLNFDRELKAISIAEIASSLAHEINQPLATISTFIQGCIHQLETEAVNPAEFLYILKEAQLQSERIGDIVHRIKNSVKKKYLYIEPTRFIEIVDESIRFVRYEKNNHDININHHANAQIPMMLIDRIQIQQVLVNLLRNSIEALLDDNMHNPDISILYHVINQETLMLEIVDNGPGFPLEVLNQKNLSITTKADGMGMGLCICRSIIEAHGGHLTLENLLEGGAKVKITIPVILE